ncbi:MAG: phytoene desaturase family protein [Caldilinea sp.]
MAPKIIIIGAGVAGLAAGCYAQMNGYESHIFELHDIPGGLCTAWDRKGYTFDGCIHYLFGSGVGMPFHRMWEELGAVQDRPMINHDKLLQVQGGDGRTLTVYCDPDRLEAEIAAISPTDAALAKELAHGVRTFTTFDMTVMQEKPRTLMKAQEYARFGQHMLPFVMPLLKFGMTQALSYARRFRDPFLREAVARMFGWPEMPMMAGMQLLAYMHNGNAGFPTGGSLAFARAIEQRYLALGGRISYKAQVEQILVENDCVTGVRLYNDEIHPTDIVIAACDGRATIFHMLDGRYVDNRLRKLYMGDLPLQSMMQVSFGVNADLSQHPHWTTYLLDEPMLIASQERSDISVQHYAYDPSLAPAGKTAMTVLLKSDYDYWQRIYGRKLYDTEQLQVADQLLTLIEQRHPGIRAQVEVTDVATPVSFERYTGNWQGSTCGWLLTPQTMRLMIQGLPKTLPRLRNLYLAGQWVEPGGSVTLCAASGRNAVQMICAADGRPFRSEG